MIGFPLPARRGLAQAIRAVILAGAVATALSACADSSYFLSDSERDELYGLELLIGNLELPEGALLVPGAAIRPRISLAAGVAAPASLSLELIPAGGGGALRTGLSLGKPDPASGKTLPLLGRDAFVESMLDLLPPIAVPSGLEPGAYYLELRALGRDGMELAVISRAVFVAAREPAAASIAIYPGVVRPGGMLLLVADVDTAGFDPWIRWSAQGVVLSEGYASKGYARLLWRAPTEAVASTLTFEWFPATPHRTGLTGVLKEKVSILVSAKPTPATDEFADSRNFERLFHLEGDFLEAKGSLEALVSGSPLPDAWSGGVGYRFGQGQGFSMTLDESPRNPGFSLVARLGIDRGAAGTVIGVANGKGAVVVVARDGRLFLELPGRTGDLAVPGPAIPARVFTLSTSVVPVAKRLSVSWHIDGLPVQTAWFEIDAGEWGPYDRFTVGGAAGFYDEAGLWRSPEPRAAYPAWARNQAARYGSALLAAEGFETLAVPESFTRSSGAQATSEGLALDPGASAWLARSFPVSVPLRVRFEGDAVLALAAPGGALLATISSDGMVRFPEAGPASILDPTGGFVISVDGGALSVSSDRSAARAVAPFDGESLALGFVASGGRSFVRRFTILSETTVDSVGK